MLTPDHIKVSAFATAAYQCVVLLGADLQQVGSGGEPGVAAVQDLLSVVAHVKQQAAILKPLNQT